MIRESPLPNFSESHSRAAYLNHQSQLIRLAIAGSLRPTVPSHPWCFPFSASPTYQISSMNARCTWVFSLVLMCSIPHVKSVRLSQASTDSPHPSSADVISHPELGFLELKVEHKTLGVGWTLSDNFKSLLCEPSTV